MLFLFVLYFHANTKKRKAKSWFGIVVTHEYVIAIKFYAIQNFLKIIWTCLLDFVIIDIDLVLSRYVYDHEILSTCIVLFCKNAVVFYFCFFLRTNLQEHKNLFSSNIVYLDSYPAIFLYRIDLVSNF